MQPITPVPSTNPTAANSRQGRTTRSMRATSWAQTWRPELVGVAVAALLLGGFSAVVSASVVQAEGERRAAYVSHQVRMACESLTAAPQRRACINTHEAQAKGWQAPSPAAARQVQALASLI